MSKNICKRVCDNRQNWTVDIDLKFLYEILKE